MLQGLRLYRKGERAYFWIGMDKKHSPKNW